MEASSWHQGFIQKTFQNLGGFKISEKMCQSSWYLQGFCQEWRTAQKPSKTNGFWYIFIQNLKKPLGKHDFFQWKLRPGTKASSKKPSKT